jgi:hypothetical protein
VVPEGADGVGPGARVNKLEPEIQGSVAIFSTAWVVHDVVWSFEGLAPFSG